MIEVTGAELPTTSHDDVDRSLVRSRIFGVTATAQRVTATPIDQM